MQNAELWGKNYKFLGLLAISHWPLAFQWRNF